MNKNSEPKTNVELGEFPYPLSDGPKESRYLTWLRNHSNYMAVRGFLDYLRSIGVLVRGIVVNFLIILPVLLLISIALGYLHHWMLAHPFGLTLWVMVAALGWTLFFPILMPLYKIYNHKKSQETGRESSVKQRDLYERSFGAVLLIFIGSAFLEAVPWALEVFHDLKRSEKFGWTGILATLGGALVVLSGSDRLLSLLSGVARKVGMVVIGLLSVLVPLAVIIFAAEFLVYGTPPTPLVMFSPLIVPVVGVAGMVIAIPIGILRGAFGWKECAAFAGMIVAGLFLVWGIVVAGDNAAQRGETAREKLSEIIEPFQRLSSDFDLIASNDIELSPKVTELVNELAIVQREHLMMEEDVKQGLKRLQAEIEDHGAEAPTSLAQKWKGGYWSSRSKVAELMGGYFESGQQFVKLGDELSGMPRGSLEPLRREIAKRAHQKLLGEFQYKVNKFADTGESSLRALKAVEQLNARLPQKPGERTGRDQGFLPLRIEDVANAGVEREEVKEAASKHSKSLTFEPELRGRLVELYFDGVLDDEVAPLALKPQDLVDKALDRVRRDFRLWTEAQLTTLVSKRELEELVTKGAAGDAGSAARIGKSGLPGDTKLLTKEEMMELVAEDDLREVILEKLPEDLPLVALQKLIERELPGSLKEPTADAARVLGQIVELPERPAKDAERLFRSIVAKSISEHVKVKEQRDRVSQALDNLWKLERPGDAGEGVVEPTGDGTDKDSEKTAATEALKAVRAAVDRAKQELEAAELAAEPEMESLVKNVARMKLAKLALAGFNAKSLRVALLRWDLDSYPDEKVVNALRKEVFGRRGVRDLEIAKLQSMANLAVSAFKEPAEGNDGAKRSQDLDGEPTYYISREDFYKLLLAEKALGENEGKLVETRGRLQREKGELEGQKRSLEQDQARIAKLLSDDGLKVARDENARKLAENESALDANERDLNSVIRRRAEVARGLLINKALGFGIGSDEVEVSEEAKRARIVLGDLITMGDDREGLTGLKHPFGAEELERISAERFKDPDSAALDSLVSTLVFGEHGPLDQDSLKGVKEKLTKAVIAPKAIFIFLLAGVIMLGCWMTVDVNLTSVHGLYRDRLATAYLVGEDKGGDVDIEEDIDLEDICRYDARSIAPYHLINVALNLQGSKDICIRDRNSDFFIFSKRFIGGERTGYCRSKTMEQVYPQMSLATAMAISAAAASPNMGRGTSPLLVAFMTLLNIRLGYWLPHPGLLEERQDMDAWKERKRLRAKASDEAGPEQEPLGQASCELPATDIPGFRFDEVFVSEVDDIARRWKQAYPGRAERSLATKLVTKRVTKSVGRQSKEVDETVEVVEAVPTVRHSLFGIGISGGGIRSATINLGIAQVLHKWGVFRHIDYMSTVSGGGYLGTGISTLMRSRTKLHSEIDGTVKITSTENEKVVEISGERKSSEPVEYRFAPKAELDVENGENISAGRLLIRHRNSEYRTEISGSVKVSIDSDRNDERVVKVSPSRPGESREYRFSRFARLLVKTGDTVSEGDPLVRVHNSLWDQFRWRVRPTALLREMGSRLDEKHRWVNLSDGGHIENLATIELLRRRCRFIVIGDGEADPVMQFNGLATLIRTAQIDLGVRIDIKLDDLRLRKSDNGETGSERHWTVGLIKYPEKDESGRNEVGILLYLKSSFTGDENEVIQEYRRRHPAFPHQSTADQMFDEGQFEAYRALGEHIAKRVLRYAPLKSQLNFRDIEMWFKALADERGLEWKERLRVAKPKAPSEVRAPNARATRKPAATTRKTPAKKKTTTKKATTKKKKTARKRGKEPS